MTLNITNLDRLISHLEGLPEEKFDMRYIFTRNGRIIFDNVPQHECGTAACIAGNIAWIGNDTTEWWGGLEAAAWLGIRQDPADELFMPEGWDETPEIFPLSRAIRTLKHMRAEFLRTGQVVVDWDAPEPTARKDWGAPKVSEQKLPAEITKLLTLTVRAEVL